MSNDKDFYPEYDFNRVALLMGIYTGIMKDGISQLNPIAHAAFEELKQMVADQQPQDEPGLMAQQEADEADEDETDDGDDGQSNPPITPRAIPSNPARRS